MSALVTIPNLHDRQDASDSDTLALAVDQATAWGIDLRKLSYLHQKIWTEQERFLAAYRIKGTIAEALEQVSVVRRTVELWRQRDLLHFQDRLLDAHETFTDSQETIIYNLNKGLKPGQSPLSVLASLNANRAEKWRPNIKLTHDVPNEVIQQMRELQAQALALRQGQPQDSSEPTEKIVEGSVASPDEDRLPWE